MTVQDILNRVFLTGRFSEAEATSELSKQSLRFLIEKKVLKSQGEGTWVEDEAVTEKILNPNAGKPICGHCRRQGNMGCWSPYCGCFCNNGCLVAHTRKCRACAISIATEK